MSDLNKLVITGRLCKDPESRFTNGGMQIMTFSIRLEIEKATIQREMFIQAHREIQIVLSQILNTYNDASVAFSQPRFKEVVIREDNSNSRFR